ncbi:MAG: hypothetical protein A3B89_01225 [Candidatus Buchananbacteria bacterium RIFCSPHIGHO2_02_FULL_40_13]|uniref:Uncharacterized protein n=1 Tax=Candidatus Buchananbacteria bacterium RIFCSPLOWO2_01_FULL_39_33 TaxID=1797543 RepID=A0A1G1YLF3_9BACT|nr:MAG: hypothetical protein A2820_03380 [Candidatus Buchananbacteria bacterium RIFCSPHIGHO2_01_FULL_40_35]OGY50112.1 MAG: hypothetical protein A3B89_01225 [Candidatus Buchananbacteria bacterium RIFCSPHIGHO2_02_FULL_40_13]OGY53094.1 MAG: hypothetical protein A3A02_00040 [Candidatus Buchananbacteria bacterium RIFCSPLOWO2_01_FULL_39_33]
MDIALGVLIILLGVAGLIWFFKFRNFPVINRDANIAQSSVLVETPSLDKKTQLCQALPDQTMTLIGEPERAIRASITLNEMFKHQSSEPWSRTGVISKALALAGDIWIFKIPDQEAGQPIWLKGEKIYTPSLLSFYKGSDESPGPARVFKENGQTNPVPYSLPKNLTPGVIWEVVDIGAFNAEVEGEDSCVNSGDLMYFVTSKEKDGGHWLVFLDARKGEAKGSGGLFLLEPFEPSVDVTDLM